MGGRGVTLFILFFKYNQRPQIVYDHMSGSQETCLCSISTERILPCFSCLSFFFFLLRGQRGFDTCSPVIVTEGVRGAEREGTATCE